MPGPEQGRQPPMGKLPPAVAHRVTLYDVHTGEAVTVFPVDAGELLASGQYGRQKPTKAAAPKAAPKAEHPAK